jgi:hypothetical protein
MDLKIPPGTSNQGHTNLCKTCKGDLSKANKEEEGRSSYNPCYTNVIMGNEIIL